MHAPGEIIDGKYRLARLLGEGGMGSVYLAEHEHLGNPFAIKFLHSNEVSDPKAMARFQREAIAAAAIGHRGIIEVYDIGTSDRGIPFLVMEYLEGQSLHDHISEKKQLDIPSAAFITAQILSALGAAHSAGIIHRDLKPDNLFLVDVGRRRPEVKLLDFGVSKLIEHQFDDESLTTTGAMLGTPSYMSPEQASGSPTIDWRADIYSVGAVLYECLTGVLPSSGKNYNEVIVNILMKPVRPIAEVDPELDPGLVAVVSRALEKDPDRRYQTAEAFLDDILAYVAADDIGQIYPVTAPKRLDRDPSDESAAPARKHSNTGDSGETEVSNSSWPDGEDFETSETLHASSVGGSVTSDHGWHSDDADNPELPPAPPHHEQQPQSSWTSRGWIIALIVVLSLALGSAVTVMVMSAMGENDRATPAGEP